MDRILEAAKAVVSARLSVEALCPLPAPVRPQDVAEAYQVQNAVHAMLAETEWGRVVGYKIGCTTSVMQQYLKIAHPCAGGLFSGRIHQGRANLNHGGYFRPGIECEIAVRLGRDLSPADAPFTADKVAEAVESYMPAIEVVDERYADWPQTEAPTLIADDFFAAGCVLGAPTPRQALPDLAQLTGQTFINGVEAARGAGADVMGHPHNALAWLASNLAGRGKALRAGEIVLTGSLVQTQWPAPQAEVVVSISGLGTVSLTFSSAAPNAR
jgi:2-keto-4-pentenoate hydratase